jgi:hypothetical protein
MRAILQDIVKLLVGEREPRFEFERVIRLFEFQTWILWPGTNIPDGAGLIVAALLLEAIEEEIFIDESDKTQREVDPDSMPSVDLSTKPPATLHRISVLRGHKAYRNVHDHIIAAHGGFTKLLYSPSPTEFDAEVLRRREKTKKIVNLIDYRLRYAQHRGADGGANISHAVFFEWWPTRKIPGKRGVTPMNKSLSPKTLFSWWGQLKSSAIFIYLNERHGFSQIPQIGDADLQDLKVLAKASANVDELRRFFGSYAQIAEAIQNAGGESPSVIVPDSVSRVPVASSPFTEAELNVISQYGENYVLMTQPTFELRRRKMTGGKKNKRKT